MPYFPQLWRVICATLCTTILLTQASFSAEYTFSTWLNGWRKNANDKSPHLFGIETNRYGFSLNVTNFDECKFGRIQGQSSYQEALAHRPSNITNRPDSKLTLSIEANGELYHAKTSGVSAAKGVKKLSSVRLWESGRYVQHYDLLGLDFRNSSGQRLKCKGRLDLLAWPDTLTFTLHVTPEEDWSESILRIAINGRAMKSSQQQKITTRWKAGEEKSLTLTCDLNSKIKAKPKPIQLTIKDSRRKNHRVTFDPQRNCHVATINRLKRSWKTGYTDIRNYDDFHLRVSGGTSEKTIPFLLHLRHPANITGICPILCDEDGTPTGIPVQLSKNWHHQERGNYLMVYAKLPAGKPANFILRLAYGHYGKLPSASHAQLSLIGYGGPYAGNGRWDQLAIGCWGETICFDMDMSLVDVSITDIRMLMARSGAQGEKWGWTEAGWGGDWLNVRDHHQKKYFQNHLKTAYLSHGPCLTHAQHKGFYGAHQEVAFTAQVETLRTDDYARTFQRLRYTFTKNVSATDLWLFKIGRSFDYQSPRLAYGNLDGLLAEQVIPDTIKAGQLALDETELTGPAPHWIAFPGASSHHSKNPKPNGYRALIIRDYHARIGGKTFTQPVIKSPLFKDTPTNLDLELLPPRGIRQFQKGDYIELDLELITLPRIADDYYGPNTQFRKHLKQHPNSWKTTHREAQLNTLKIEVTGGLVKRNYPIIIQAQAPVVKLTIQGGAGAVPLQLQGLNSATGHQLFRLINGQHTPFDQSVHGNDFWQTDFDEATQTYTVTYNLPLDGLKSSKWTFKQGK